MNHLNTVYDCSIIELKHISNEIGYVSSVEGTSNISFDIKRVYYISEIPLDVTRGGHGHKCLRQLLVATTGSFDIILDDGLNKQVCTLNQPYQGLLIVPGIWREIVNFSPEATCLVLASLDYDEAEYIRDYDEFLKFKKKYY